MAKRTMEKGKGTFAAPAVLTFTPQSVDAHEWHLSFINTHAINSALFTVRFIDYDGATADIVLADPDDPVITVPPADGGHAKTYTIPAQACQVTVNALVALSGHVLFKAVELYDFVSDGDYPAAAVDGTASGPVTVVNL